MFRYFLKRLLYAIPILIGVNLITFSLFFVLNSPDDVARAHLGQKHVSAEAIHDWEIAHGYNLPRFYNADASGLSHLTQTLFFQKSLKLFLFDFGESDSGRDISDDIVSRMSASLALAIPILLLGLLVNITAALMMVFFRFSFLDTSAVIACIILMSISALFYIIGGQYLFAKMLRLMPISGYDSGLSMIKFLFLPVIVSLLAGLGSGARWYRTIFLEEIQKDYVRTARAKGLSQMRVLFAHVLRNAMIPIVTGVVVIIPTLFMGSLILEAFFAIPGLGSYTIDAMAAQDFSIVRAMVFLGSLLYIIGLMLTDLCYGLVDPRVRVNHHAE